MPSVDSDRRRCGWVDCTRAGLFGRLRGRQTAVGAGGRDSIGSAGVAPMTYSITSARSASLLRRLYRPTWCALPRAFVPAEGATKPWGELRERGPAGQRRQRPGSSGGCPVQGPISAVLSTGRTPCSWASAPKTDSTATAASPQSQARDSLTRSVTDPGATHRT